MSGQSAQPCTVCSYRVHYITTINHRKCHVSPNNVVLLVEFVIELERMIRNKEKGKWLSPCMVSCSVMQWGEHVHGAGPGGVAAAVQCDHRLTAAAASSHCSSRTFRCQHVDPGPRRVFRPLLLQLLHFVGQETIDVSGGISDRWVETRLWKCRYEGICCQVSWWWSCTCPTRSSSSPPPATFCCNNLGSGDNF